MRNESFIRSADFMFWLHRLAPLNLAENRAPICKPFLQFAAKMKEKRTEKMCARTIFAIFLRAGFRFYEFFSSFMVYIERCMMKAYPNIDTSWLFPSAIMKHSIREHFFSHMHFFKRLNHMKRKTALLMERKHKYSSIFLALMLHHPAAF